MRAWVTCPFRGHTPARERVQALRRHGHLVSSTPEPVRPHVADSVRSTCAVDLSQQLPYRNLEIAVTLAPRGNSARQTTRALWCEVVLMLPIRSSTTGWERLALVGPAVERSVLPPERAIFAHHEQVLRELYLLVAPTTSQAVNHYEGFGVRASETLTDYLRLSRE